MKIAVCLVMAGLAAGALAQTVLVESESFAEHGGWVLDTQSIEQMGSPYLLAHGLGSPVADASTAVVFPQAGSYRLWVRTRDWVPEHAGDPGQFKVVLNDTELAPVFGIGPGLWHWQDGGVVSIDDPSNNVVRLRDLTGFDGRCDAIAFCADTNEAPPDDGAALAAWRAAALGEATDPEVTESFDFVVVGGGLAGCAAAIAAGSNGLSVALLQDRPYVGGNASREIRVATLGVVRHPIVQTLRNSAGNSSENASTYDNQRLAAVTNAPNVHLFLHWRAYGVQTNASGRITAVDARHVRTGARRRFLAPLFADCTGDGWIGYWAGAAWRMGREARSEFNESLAPVAHDAMTMGSSLMWYSRSAASPTGFPEVAWAMDVAGTAANTDGGWNWEYGLNRNTIADAEAIRDHLLRAIYGNFYNAKLLPANANLVLGWVPYIAGKRESRRLIGDHLLTENDVREHVFFEDAVATESRDIDLHYTQAGGPDYRTYAAYTKIEPYYIPFRSLYARDVPNLMMAGRCFSCTHVGLGSPRVMHTGGQMGVAVGCAAAVCKAHGIEPRDLYRSEAHTLELQSRIGGTWPDRPLPFTDVVDNSETSRGATVIGTWTSSDSNTGYYYTNYLHDGNSGKGTKSVCFTPELPVAGEYRVFLRWSAADNRATDVPVTIVTNGPSLVPQDAPHIRRGSPTTTYNDTELLVGRVAANNWIRGLLDFDLSSIPDDARIHAVELLLTIHARDTSSATDWVGADGLRLYRLTEEFAPTQVTWSNRASGTPWTTAGGTFDTNALAIIAAPTNPSEVVAGERFVLHGLPAFADAVQQALASDRLQLVLRTPTIETGYDARKIYRFASEAFADASWRPQLVIAYTAPGVGAVEVIVNQTQNGGAWNDLGTYALAAGRRAHVIIGNTNTSGYVIADAAAFALPGSTADDRDGDGLPNWWERFFFLGETNAVPDEDVDVDGWSNYWEFFLGTDPQDARSRFSVREMLGNMGGGFVISWPSASNRTYRIESTTDLQAGFTNLVSGIPATPPLNTYTVTVDHATQFFRVAPE